MRVAASVFALVAVACITVAIVGMVTGRPSTFACSVRCDTSTSCRGTKRQSA